MRQPAGLVAKASILSISFLDAGPEAEHEHVGNYSLVVGVRSHTHTHAFTSHSRPQPSVLVRPRRTAGRTAAGGLSELSANCQPRHLECHCTHAATNPSLPQDPYYSAQSSRPRTALMGMLLKREWSPWGRPYVQLSSSDPAPWPAALRRRGQCAGRLPPYWSA